MRRNVEAYKSSPLKMELAANQLLERYLTKSLKESDLSGYALLRESIITMTVDSYAFSSEAINAMDYDDYLNDINLPTLVIAGELDVPTPPSRMQMYRKEIRDAQWAVIEGAAHLPNFEKPKQFNLVLTKFLGQLRK
jgi:3-oxoadipate enol-lactonase